MEAVPRLPMISFQLKVSPEPTVFGPKLKQYIRDFYNEDPESYTNEIHQLENLRATAVRPPIAVAGCSLLKRYYCQLHFVQSRFPMGIDEPAAVSFSWRDTYANMVFSLSNIRFEIISILYNIGAIHTQLGARTERTSADGMKMACSHFQCAAWAFEHLQNSYPQPPGVDMAPELMKFMHQLCLAQAQECILEKSMLDNRKPTIVAKVAKQIVDYYALALWTLEPSNSEESTIADTVGSKTYKSWKTYVKFKRSYHMAVTLLYQGLTSEEQQKMGERVAFYNAALTSLNSARALHAGAKGSTGITGVAGEKEAIEEALVFTNDVIEGKRKAAKNENEFIYHEEVPEKDALPTVNGASLVKGISFNVNDPEVSGPDIFARLVPMKVHEASSLYSEEKAKKLRAVGSKIEEKDQALEMFLASLKLQHLSLWDPDRTIDADTLPFPEGLAERCAALNAKPTAIQDLEDITAKLSATYGDVETMLKNIDKLLTEEDQKEKLYQEAMGKRPPSIVATDLTREAKKYDEAHAKASESNQALHRAMSLHLNNLQKLSQPLDQLMASIPSIDHNVKGGSETEKQNVRELKRILGKVEEMQKQRSELYSKLRESISSDNLTRILVTATAESAPLDTLFSEQLEKHQSLINLIDQNLAAQDNILTALTDAYARTVETRKSVEEVMKKRESMISALINSYDAYEDLLAKASKGLEFYRKLEMNVTKLLQRVKSTCRVQEEEREQILARNGKTSSSESTVSMTPEKKTGSGMKLRDHLANRLKNNPSYQNTYGDKQTIPVAPVQPNTHTPIKPYSTESPIGSDSIPIHAVPPMTTDPALQDPQQMYQYYGYNNYYMNQGNSYIPQHYNYTSTSQSTSVQGFAKSNTTNSENMYHQAGNITNTEVASNSNQYAGYNNIRNDSISLPQNQTQYTDQGYEDANAYSQYSDYRTNQGYTIANTGYQAVQGQQSNYNQSYQTLPPNQSPSHVSAGQLQPANIGQDQNSQNSSTGTQQYEFQNVNREVYVNPYQPTIQQQQQIQPTISENLPNYSVSHDTPSLPSSLPHTSLSQQIYPQETSNLQYPVAQNLQQPSVHTANPGYNVPEQYLTNQTTGITSNDTSPLPSTYSGTPSNVSGANPINQQYYHTNNNTSIQTVTAYVLPSQQGYVEGGQPSVPTSQVPVNPPIQTYPNTYGQAYSIDANGHQYQMPPNSIAAQGISVNYANDPEIIQSHAKPSNVQGLIQNYQYSLQGHSGAMQYSTYPQGYTNSWDGQQVHTSSSDSYQGHPGYSYNPTLGGYEYSSGYQNSQSTQQVTISNQTSQSNDHSNSHYTNANNDSTTNITTSTQYSNGSFQSEVGSTAINSQPNTSYVQTYTQSSNNSKTTTSTTNSDIKKSDVSSTPKSNLDLLADLDITINHAPLVPEVHPIDKEIKFEPTSSIHEIDKIIEKKEEDAMSLSQIDDKLENLQIVWDTWYNDVQPKKDPLGDPIILQKFINDIEKYEKFVDSLTVKTLSGSTNLDIKWKEVQDFEERELKKQTTNVAQAHSNENRTSDWIPYDSTRVIITTADRSSDYINASHVKDLTQWTPTFIVAQSPIPQSFEAFWSMIWEQGSEVIACLCSDTQLNDIYWPTNKETNLTIGRFTLSLKNSMNNTTHVQRIIGIIHSEYKIERVVVHMQYLTWPATGLPSSPRPLLSFATDIMSEQALRHCPKPIVVHCLVGGPLSGLFLLAAATVCHVRAGNGVVDVPLVFSTLVKYRRCLISKEFLLFGYRMVLYHAQDTLMKRGILSSTKSTFDGFDNRKGNKGRLVKKNQHAHPSDDFLHNLGVGMQHGLVRQQVKDDKVGQSASQITVDPEEKTDRAQPVDPLSQLDPLWSIRK
ncbi:tyrosine-protein phosphatase non-receptor type 23 [Microplitis demolitor]|uniref:tyrosine-protein phosphatase non-receptor type 23 n=1 Tax=Microplitis demolitor TaxID=69319 RepID=UPI0004CCE17F|nr:tyrosine-protein phosphatase non-receptor type 23 [Microplitis demolitor]